MAGSGRAVWLSGPIEGIPPLLLPVAHSLTESKEDVQRLLADVPLDILWRRPGSAAAAGFHVKHAMGSLDRLLTYARGESLSDAQLAILAGEKSLDRTAGDGAQLSREFSAAIDRALAQLRATPEDSLLQRREVGRAKLPSNVLGLLVHAAEHTYRHIGQLSTTLRIASSAS